MLSGGEVDEPPVFQETVDPNDHADISGQSAPAMGCTKVLFDVFQPHPDHRVSIVPVELGVANPEGKGGFLIALLEELGEAVFLYLVDLREGEPGSEGWKGEMGRRLYDSAGDGHSVLLEP